MADITNNLGLTKPSQSDFYNVDDFNKNFQAIDNFSALCLRYFNGFEAMNTAMGTSYDATTSIETIIQSLPDNTGLIADINTHDKHGTGVELYPAVYGILTIYKIRENRVSVEYVSNEAKNSTRYNRRWVGQYNDGVFGGFKQVFTEDNPLPIEWNDGKTYVVGQGDGNFIIQNYKVTSNGNDDFITFHNTQPLVSILRVFRNSTSYKLFGDHNKPTVTYTGSGTSPQTVAVGGIGSVALITSDENRMGIVGKKGGIMWGFPPPGESITNSVSMWCHGADRLKFDNGVLTFNYENNAINLLNHPGELYTCYVL